MAARCISHGPARRSPYLWKVAGVILTWLTGVGYVTLEDPGDYSEERLGLGLYVLLGNTTIVRSKTDATCASSEALALGNEAEHPGNGPGNRHAPKEGTVAAIVDDNFDFPCAHAVKGNERSR